MLFTALRDRVGWVRLHTSPITFSSGSMLHVKEGHIAFVADRFLVHQTEILEYLALLRLVQ
jgi:hypothetical protein